MEETRFHGLDPRAQEFVPRNHQFSFVSNNFFYSYTSLPPPPYFHPPSPLPGQPPICDGSYSSPPNSCLPGYPQPAAYGNVDHHSMVVPSSFNNSWSPRTMPSRALLLTMVPSDVSESTVRRELEIFGDVRAVQMERVREGIVTVHFYDLRESQKALTEIQEQHMQQQYRLRRHYESTVSSSAAAAALPPPLPTPAPGLIAGRAVWAQFTAPAVSSLPDGNNQGTLVIFNLDPDVSTNILKQTFEAFGNVKELRETPMKRHQRFIEFYDVRNAAKALAEMNGKEIHGKQIVIEFSRPGGLSKKNSKFSASSSTTRLNFVGNLSLRPSRMIMPQPLPPPPPPPHPLPTTTTCQSSSERRPSYYSKVNPKGGNCEKRCSSSIQNSMASLTVNDENTNTASAADGKLSISKKNGKKSGNHVVINPTGAPKQYQHMNLQQQQQTNKGKPWKGSSRQSKEYDPRFLIIEDAITESNCRDSRTTVMIKNIPNKYSQKLLLNMLDNHCIHCNEQIADGDDHPLSSYDFVYLPIDFVNKCNVGYGFVNMTSPEATLRLYKAFHRQSWEVFNSRKICEVTYARLQGVEALKEHFKNSKFPSEADEYMPVIFSPPRDGRRLSDPVPIVCRANMTTSPTNRTCSSSSPAVSSKEEEEEEEEETSENGRGGDIVDYGNIRDGIVIINGNAGRRDNGKNSDVDGSSSNGGDSGGDRQYYDDNDDGRSEHLTL